jgi:hypothetical protein
VLGFALRTQKTSGYIYIALTSAFYKNGKRKVRMVVIVD